MTKRDELIRGFTSALDTFTPREFAIQQMVSNVLQREAKVLDAVEKPLKEMSDELREINLRLPLTKRCQEAIDEALYKIKELRGK